jgi:hypothetical protein
MTHICPFFHPQAAPSSLTDYAVFPVLSAVDWHTIRATTFDDDNNIIVAVEIEVETLLV